MNEFDTTVSGPGQGDPHHPQFTGQQYTEPQYTGQQPYPGQPYNGQSPYHAPAGSQPYLYQGPPPAQKRTSPLEALALIPAGMHMIVMFIVSILIFLLYLAFIGYIAQLFAFITCGFLIVSVIAGIYYLFEPTPPANPYSQFSLNMINDSSEKSKGETQQRGGHYPPHYYPDQVPPQYPDQNPPQYPDQESPEDPNY